MTQDGIVGFVRPVVTLALTGVFCMLALQGQLSSEVFMSTITMVLVFWFKDHGDEKVADQIVKKLVETELPKA